MRKILKLVLITTLTVLLLNPAIIVNLQVQSEDQPTKSTYLRSHQKPEEQSPIVNIAKEKGFNQTFKVALITGDVVTVANTTNGLEVLSIEPSDPQRKGQAFQILNLHGDVYVIPSYVDTKKYDLSLFDVSYLVKEKYYDSTYLPIIVKASSTSALSSIAESAIKFNASVKTVSTPLVLSSVRVKNEKSSITSLFKNILEKEEVSKVWLDKKVHVKLDVSVPLVGAPEAWNLGYNGSGIKIAILDTGIDPTHPDFYFPNGTYKVVLNASFVEYPSEEVGNATDLHGHGTHCASIAAGTGLASGGFFTGVAPGARLIVGKVLNRDGWGYLSWVISGINWAVINGANIISMSLSDDYTDGTDLLSVACDWAVSQGVVVVVAAGNSGPNYFTTTSPGTAFNVITVGASDDYDDIALFSSRGPTFNLRIKPNIVAPGVGIVAAWPGGDYAYLSGTSMATPHVSGASAIVLQRFPSLTPGDVKNLLLSTSKWLPNYNVYQQGAGRLNVSYAVSPALFLDPSEVNLRIPSLNIVNTTITLKNLYSRSMTLSFDVAYFSMDPHATLLPSNAFYVANNSVTLPAGGQAKIVFVANFTALPKYDYWGIIKVLNSSSPRQVLAHGVFSAFNWLKLSVLKLDKNGNPLAFNFVAVSPNSTGGPMQEYMWGYTNSTGWVDFYLPEGFYNVYTDRYDDTIGSTYIIVKQARLTSNTLLTFDERETKEVKLSNSPGLSPIEKQFNIMIPFWSDWFDPLRLMWLIYCPTSLSDYILTPYPVLSSYKLIPTDKLNPTYPSLIESDTLYMPQAFFENVLSSKTINPTYNFSTSVEYRTYACPRMSAKTWFYNGLDAYYNSSLYTLYVGTITYFVNIPKRILILMNPFWLGTSVGGVWMDVYSEKNRDLPGVSTPYWYYWSYVPPLMNLYYRGIYSSKIYIAAEPEYRQAGGVFLLEDGRLRVLRFWSSLYPSLNETVAYYEGVYYGFKLLVNGTDITDQVDKYWHRSFMYGWDYDINFSLPARVEVFLNFTSDHVLSGTVNSKYTFIVENWGDGWYWAVVPLRFYRDRAIEVVDLDWNNTLTTVKPVVVNVNIHSWYDLTHAVLMYRFGGSWYNSTLAYFHPSNRSFTFLLDPMVNNTFVDLLIYFRDMKGNEMVENITRAFYVNKVFTPRAVLTLADLPAPFVSKGAVNATLTPGSSDRRGPCDPAHTIDVAAAQHVAFALGRLSQAGSVDVCMDWEASNYNSTHVYRVYKPGNIITFGFPTVNTIGWYYNYYLNVLPVCFGVDANGAFIRVRDTGNTYRKINDYYQGVQVTDYAAIELYYDEADKRSVLIIAGLSGFSTREAAKWLTTQLVSGTPLPDARGIVLRLYDSNGDTSFEEIQIVEAAP